MIGIDLGDLLNPVFLALMMRERAVRIGNPDLAIGAMAGFAAIHEGYPARHVGLHRQDLQVEHHLEIAGEQHRHARRLLNSGGDVAMFRLCVLYLPFNLAALRKKTSSMP
jgi:hypothetical protein